MNIWDKIKDGLNMGKDKVISSIIGIGNFLKSRENRVVLGVVLGGLSAGLIISGYVKLPQ